MKSVAETEIRSGERNWIGSKEHAPEKEFVMNQVMNLEKDTKAIEQLIGQGTVLWGQVTRVGNDHDRGMAYMRVALRGDELPHRYTCIVYRDEADAEFKSGHLLYLVGHRVPVTVIGIDKEHQRLIGSRKRAQEKNKVDMLQDLASGKEMEGTILNFVSYGAYVEVNGVVGLLKNTDYSIDFSEIRESHNAGDVLTVKCKEVTNEGKIFWVLPEKTHRAKPIDWNIEPDTALLGTVQNICSFANGVGIFVRIAPGLDALCTIPQNVEVEVGTRVSVHITSIEPAAEAYMPPRVKGRIMRVV